MRDLDLIYVLFNVAGAFLVMVSGSQSPSTWSPLPDPLYPASYREEEGKQGSRRATQKALSTRPGSHPYYYIFFSIINQNKPVTSPTSGQVR